MYAHNCVCMRTLMKPACSQHLMTDVAILDECRTRITSGYVDKNIDTTKLIEIDRTKPFTLPFTQVINSYWDFNEFDSWKHYSDGIDISTLSSLTLYMVEVKASHVFQ